MSKHGITKLNNLTKLGLNWAKPSVNELARRRNAQLRVSAQRQSAVRAAAKRPNSPKRKNSPKRAKTPSPPKMSIGARAQLPVVITYPNGRVKVVFRTTKGYYVPNASKPHGFNFGRRV
jgi:hypothetical protein